MANAVPTAEGALSSWPWSSCPSPSTAPGCWCMGFGRVGRLAAQRLPPWGPGLAWRPGGMSSWPGRRAMGYGAEHHRPVWTGWLCGYDLVVNTVPAPRTGGDGTGRSEARLPHHRPGLQARRGGPQGRGDRLGRHGDLGPVPPRQGGPCHRWRRHSEHHLQHAPRAGTCDIWKGRLQYGT